MGRYHHAASVLFIAGSLVEAWELAPASFSTIISFHFKRSIRGLLLKNSTQDDQYYSNCCKDKTCCVVDFELNVE